MQDEAKAEFAARVERIRAGGAGTNRTLFVGNDATFAIPKDFSSRKAQKARRGGLTLWLVLTVMAGSAFVGALSADLPVADFMQPLAERLKAV